MINHVQRLYEDLLGLAVDRMLEEPPAGHTVSFNAKQV